MYEKSVENPKRLVLRPGSQSFIAGSSYCSSQSDFNERYSSWNGKHEIYANSLGYYKGRKFTIC